MKIVWKPGRQRKTVGEQDLSRGAKVLLAAVVVIAAVSGCKPAVTTEQKQVKACVEDVQQGLNDPSSLEVLATKPIQMKVGHRLELEYTAKNAMGGRVRGSAICGFKSATETTLDPEDYQNTLRSVARDLKSLGIKVK
jgi:hypothetical protein